MVDVITRIEINRPLAIVSAFASDPDNAPAWYKNIKSVKWQTPKPLAMHSRIEFEAHFLGKKLAYIYEIVELVSQQKLVMRTAQGPFPMETTYTWQAINENTTSMTLRNRGNPSGFSKLLSPFMSMAMRGANKKDLSQLKKLLESSS